MEEPTANTDLGPSAPVPEAQHTSSNSRDESATEHSPTWTEWIRLGLRASILRRVQALPEGPQAWHMLLIVATVILIGIGAARLEIVGPAAFNVRSWLFGFAPTALVIFAAWFALNLAPSSALRSSPVAAWYLLYSIATLPITLVGAALGALVARGHLAKWWAAGHWLAWAIYVGLWIWFVVATWRVSQAVTRSRRVVVSLVVCVFLVGILSSWQLQTRAWHPTQSYDDDDSPFIELSQELFESQQALLDEVLRGLASTSGGERRVYGLVYAPYNQDVFLRESAMVQSLLEERFGAHGRVVRLLNNSTTDTTLPWATPLNLERSLQALANAMDPERDVLVVYLTSHGGADFKLAAEHWPLHVKELTADELREILDQVGIRHRVIAVSACYSGGWIEPLQNADTLVMTAADKEHTSYGCGSKSELTFFGRAVFDEQLRTTLSFEEAFNAAVPIIKQREVEARKDDGFSNPQISVGANIRAVLEELASP
jgi:hypothetical protein